MKVKFEVDGRPQKAHESWYRGEHCNFNPKINNLLLPDSVIRHVIGAWAPPEPLIGPQTRICAFGSCFAANISNWLAKRNFNVLTQQDESKRAYIIRFGEGLVNSYSLLQQFEWAFENKKNEVSLWHGYSAEEYGYNDEVRLETKELFESADIFILTMGLSEVWYDELTGGVFWRAVPADKFDASRHKFRVTTVDENRANIREIYRLIRKHRPSAKIIFTMSPIPLVATFRPIPCMTANSASKAILRAALDEFLREVIDEGFAYYWPSYEIVLDVFSNRWKQDRRHVHDEILDFIMTAFEHVWCHGSTPRYTLAEAWIRARAVEGVLPRNLPDLFADGNVPKLNEVLAEFRHDGAREKVDLITRRAAELSLALS